jgi:hypothetical protein
VHKKIKEQINDVDSFKFQDVTVTWVGMAEVFLPYNSRRTINRAHFEDEFQVILVFSINISLGTSRYKTSCMSFSKHNKYHLSGILTLRSLILKVDR